MEKITGRPLVTLVVCTYNDESTIGTVLDAILRLQYSNLEVIVINDASTDRTREIVERYPVLAVHNSENRGLGFNQNLALKMARGDFLAMVQSDCEVLEVDWLDRMVDLMQDETAAVVVSQRIIEDFRQLPLGARLFNAVAPQDLKNGTEQPVELQYCRGKADLYRKQVLLELGGWNTAFFTAGEDTDLSIRLRQLGQRILLHPTACVRYLFSGRQVSLSGALRKAYLYGRTAYPLYSLHRYDGIQARTYMTLLLAFLLLPFPLLVRGVAGGALFLYSWTCVIQTAFLPAMSYGLLASFVGVLPLMINYFSGSPHVAGIPHFSLALSGSAYLAYLAAKNSQRNRSKGERAVLMPVTFLFCMAWRLVSGAGYLSAALAGIGRKRAPALRGTSSMC